MCRVMSFLFLSLIVLARNSSDFEMSINVFSGVSHILNHFYMTYYLNLSCKISIHAIYPSILAFSCLMKEYFTHFT